MAGFGQGLGRVWAGFGQGLGRVWARRGMVGQLSLNLPRPHPSKLPKNGPGFRAEISALNKVGRGRNA